MTDMEWLRSVANWAGQHVVILLLSLSVACLLGLVVGAALRGAHDGDSEADKAIRERVAANREKRAARVHCNCVESDDEHETHLGAA